MSWNHSHLATPGWHSVASLILTAIAVKQCPLGNTSPGFHLNSKKNSLLSLSLSAPLALSFCWVYWIRLLWMEACSSAPGASSERPLFSLCPLYSNNDPAEWERSSAPDSISYWWIEFAELFISVMAIPFIIQRNDLWAKIFISTFKAMPWNILNRIMPLFLQIVPLSFRHWDIYYDWLSHFYAMISGWKVFVRICLRIWL